MEKSFVERMWGISIFFRSRRKYSFAIDSPIYIRRIPQKKEKKKTWKRDNVKNEFAHLENSFSPHLTLLVHGKLSSTWAE